jgi:hypothetical protein
MNSAAADQSLPTALVLLSEDPFSDVAEFDDDAAYDWWRDAHPDGFVLAVRARKPPMLHRAGCREIDRGEHPGRLKAKGSRQVCAEMKSALRAWAARELQTQGLIERCPKCGP